MEKTIKTKGVNTRIDEHVQKLIEHIPFVIFLIGPPYSGKGENSKRLMNVISSKKVPKSEVLLINTGKLLREFVDSEENAGALRDSVREKMNKGELVPLVLKILVYMNEINKFLKEYPNGSIVFDGSPRDKEERRALVEFFFGFKEPRKMAAIRLVVGKEELQKRTSLRNEGREDDNPEIFEERMLTYDAFADSICASLKSSGVPVENVEVFGLESKELVFSKFIKKIDEALSQIK